MPKRKVAPVKELSIEEKMDFENEMARFHDFFMDNHRNVAAMNFKIMRFADNLKTTFPDKSPAEIKNIVAKQFENFSADMKPLMTTLYLASQAVNKVMLDFTYGDLQVDSTFTDTLDDYTNGIEWYAALMFSPADAAHLTVFNSRKMDISSSDADKNAKKMGKILRDDIIPESQARRALDIQLNELVQHGIDKLKASKGQRNRHYDEGSAAIKLAKTLGKISDEYFSSPVKTDERKANFNKDFVEAISKEEHLFNGKVPLQWKAIAKNILLIVSSVATGGMVLAAKAIHSKVTTGKVSLFSHTKKKSGTQRLHTMKKNLSKVTQLEDDAIELSTIKKRKR